MRTLRYQTVIGLIVFTLANSASAELISGWFDDVIVMNNLTTSVKFKQQKLSNYQESDNLKLRVIDGKQGDKIIREDAILKKDGIWVWNKVLPFSEKLKFLILKEDKPISTEHRANTKSTLTFSASDSLNMIRGVHYLPTIAAVATDNEKKRLPIEIPEALKNCKDKVLVVVFNKETNVLLWQRFGELELTTDEIEFSKDMQPTIAIVTDEGSCGK